MWPWILLFPAKPMVFTMSTWSSWDSTQLFSYTDADTHKSDTTERVGCQASCSLRSIQAAAMRRMICSEPVSRTTFILLSQQQ